MSNPCACKALISRCVVGLVRPVASAMAVKERAPPSTASMIATVRSSTPTEVVGAGGVAAVHALFDGGSLANLQIEPRSVLDVTLDSWGGGHLLSSLSKIRN